MTFIVLTPGSRQESSTSPEDFVSFRTSEDTDGSWQNVLFKYKIKKSCWVALRIFPSSHTNPIFIIKDGKPIHELKSAEWCRKSVDQCWLMKENNIRPSERADARAAYDAARKVYDDIIREASQ